MRTSRSALSILLLLPVLAACASAPPASSPAEPGAQAAETAQARPERASEPVRTATAYASSYKPLPSRPVLITNATLLTAAGDRIEGGSLLMRDGKIAAVGRPNGGQPEAPAGVEVIDARGKWVTPGLIDAHSHLGVYPSPGVEAHSDGNEVTEPVTADMSAEHSLWPQDPQFPLALAGGVTSMLVLPGSANLIGGLGVTVKNVPGRSAMDMKFPDAPYGLKMACGENPKRVYGEKGRSPATRMGNIAVTRKAWSEARDYRRSWDSYREKVKAGKEATPPARDLEKEHLAQVLAGEILVQNHCYRADEMLAMIDLAREFGYKISAFHHAVEAYKIADVLAENGICAAMWADWWGFKMEAFDGIRENIPLVHRPQGGCAIVHSDSAEGIQRLNQEAAKAMAAGNRMGMAIRPEDAIRWLTINPAKALGIAGQTGSLEEGKMADVVVWNGSPFSVYSRTEKVFIDGALVFDRNDPARQPRTDFALGTIDAPGVNP